MNTPYAWLMTAVDQVPELIASVAGAVPPVAVDGAAGPGFLATIHPVVLVIAGAVAIPCLVVAVLLAAHLRGSSVSPDARSGARETTVIETEKEVVAIVLCTSLFAVAATVALVLLSW